MTDEYMIETAGLRKGYQIGPRRIEVLRDINFKVRRHSWTALLGASGSGKTTLLNLLGVLERPDGGGIRCAGVDYASLSGRAAARFRSEKIGFVFQSYHLLPELSIVENVMLPAMLAHRRGNWRQKAEELLCRMGLAQRLRHRPGELSGGEQQRAAIARSLINDPELLLADEPTGNLDSATGNEILEVFQALCRRERRTIVMITHNDKIAGLADKIDYLCDGCLQSGEPEPEAAGQAEMAPEPL